MSSNPMSNHESRKMARDNEVASFKLSSGPSTKRRRRKTGSPYIAPPWFWDNLSKITICHRSLREFDRRTKPIVTFAAPESLRIKSKQVAQLQRFARRGGPSLIDLRGYSTPLDRTPSPDLQNEWADTIFKADAYDAAFSRHLADHGISLANRYKPANHAEIKSRLEQRRRSLSLSGRSNVEDDYETFVEQIESARNEKSVTKDAFFFIPEHSDTFDHSGGFAFQNLKPLTDGSLDTAFPESYDGCRPEELDPSVREQLGEYIVPSSNNPYDVPCLPTFFTEYVGASGLVRVGERQVLYSSALGARAVHQLQSFATDPTTALDNNAYVLTALVHTHTGGLWIYATYPIPPLPIPSPLTFMSSPLSMIQTPHESPRRISNVVPKKLKYRMTLIKCFILTLSPEIFRQGVQAYHNAREWAKEKRDEFVRAANEKVRKEGKAKGKGRAEV